MKRKSAGFLAGVLVASMAATPLSYANVYAEEQTAISDSSVVVQQEQEEETSGEAGNVQESTTVKEEEKEETKTEETVTPEQPEAGETKKDDNAETEPGTNAQPTVDPVQNNPAVEPVQNKPADVATVQDETEKEEIVPVQPTEAIDGVKVLKNDGTAYGMFPVTVEKMEVKDNQIKIDFNTGSKKVFDWLYLGPVTDTEKSNYIVGTKTDSTCEFSVSIPLAKANSWIPVSVGRSDKGTWSENYLWMSIPDPEAPVITSQPQSVEKKTGEQVSLSVETDGTDYSYQWQYSTDGTNWTDCSDLSAKTSTYTFEMTADKVGQYRCVVSNANGSTVISDIAKVDRPSGPAVTGDQVQVVKSDGTEFSMFKISESKVLEDGENLDIMISTKNTSFDQIYLGEKEDVIKTPVIEGELKDGVWTFNFKVPASDRGKTLPVSLRKVKDGTWYSNQDLWIYIPDKGSDITPDPDPTPDPGAVVPADGTYKVNNVTSSSSMFRVVDCSLTVKNGKMSAVLTLSGTGYGYLYMGTAEEAGKADKSTWIPFKENSEGKYTYTVPVASLDKEIAVAAYSTKNEKWYDRTLTFTSDSLTKISDGNSGTNGNGGTNGGNSNSSGNNGSVLKPNDGKADGESKYESDTSGATSRVNSATTLADGVYTPDRFTWSGGTGKVKIYCNKITIKNGQAYATLVFDSEYYQYVKANGNTYYTTKGNGTATVTIPVALNQNNTILGMTTRMSNAHEIAYTIFVYLAVAGNGTTLNGTSVSKKLDEKAPEIMGLEYQSETQLDYAEYFKIYHYDQGITLLEIDMTKGTANDPEKLAAEAINAENATEDASEKSGNSNATDEKKKSENTEDVSASSTTEDGEENLNGVSEETLAAELYKGNVVKYLLVPEGVEVPVGLDQDMIVVQMPTDKAYTSTEAILEKMDELGLTNNVAAVGTEKKDCKVDSVAEKMEKKDGEDKAQVVFGGKEDEPDYKTLVKQETNLAILSSDILPKEADITDLEENQDKADSKNADKKSDEKSTKKSDDKSEKKSDKKSESQSEENTDALTVEEQNERFQQITEKFAMLGIPVIVDRSEDEQTDLAKYEWIKVYGVLFGCEDQMNTLFDQAVKDAGDDAVAQASAQTEK